MYRGVYTDSLSPLISQLNVQGYSRDTGCYRVHAEQNKQHQNCTLRIVSAQQHLAHWETQKRSFFCFVFFAVVSFQLKLDEHTDGDNNITAQWMSLHVFSIFALVWLCLSWICIFLFVYFIQFGSLVLGVFAFCVPLTTWQSNCGYTVIAFSIIFCL